MNAKERERLYGSGQYTQGLRVWLRRERTQVATRHPP